jgi:hypothetical protein
MQSNFLQIIRLKQAKGRDMAHLTEALEKQAVMHSIATLNWKEFPYKPGIGFRIGHTGDQIVIKFYVEEESVRAMETEINGAVHKDSCVEFFVSLDGSNYYNFEVNCIGTPHLAYGEGRNNRVKLSDEVMRKIKITSTLGNQPFETRTGGFSWELTAIIPVECFIFNKNLKLAGTDATANFYKCGDDLPVPHFVTWNPVGTAQPDYHRPEFFGKIRFEQ